MATTFDPYTHVTDSILAELENGTAPWRKPWTGAGPFSSSARMLSV
ncbi:MAG: DUF1738 domain-containing protein, partial [Rhodobacteraceae bacterium]|nr:DUF1738 domain-containing protein [Paracoccaceae bacterium]